LTLRKAKLCGTIAGVETEPMGIKMEEWIRMIVPAMIGAIPGFWSLWLRRKDRKKAEKDAEDSLLPIFDLTAAESFHTSGCLFMRISALNRLDADLRISQVDVVEPSAAIIAGQIPFLPYGPREDDLAKQSSSLPVKWASKALSPSERSGLSKVGDFFLKFSSSQMPKEISIRLHLRCSDLRFSRRSMIVKTKTTILNEKEKIMAM